MQAAIRSDDPVIVLHHPALAAARGTVQPEPIVLGEAVVEPVGGDVSVFATGMMAHRARSAAKALGSERSLGRGSRRVQPQPDAVGGHRHLGREDRSHAVVVDEGRLTCSVASEIAAGIGERAFGALAAPVRRLAVPDVPIPFAPSLEAAVIPSEDDIAAAAREVLRA